MAALGCRRGERARDRRADRDTARPPLARRLARVPRQPAPRARQRRRRDRADRRPAGRQPIPRLTRTDDPSRDRRCGVLARAFPSPPGSCAAACDRRSRAPARSARPVPARAACATRCARRSAIPSSSWLLAARPPGYVDIEGRPFDPAERGASTPVDRENGRIGILVHDPALRPPRAARRRRLSCAARARERASARRAPRELDALARERDFTRLVVNTAPSFFCVLDGDGSMVRFNRTLQEATGIRRRARARPAVWTSSPARRVRGGPC